ncbi:MAG TPA: immunoglobulin-like domain-containing protein [Candidatus Paceibacterota bacterium]|nr:immunoglobulin-like domain-containing protein [Candidatus Paceibacterota bacterium]
MKNISTASLLAMGMLSFVLSFALELNKLDAQSIFRIQTALAAEAPTANIFGLVREGENISETNPAKSGVFFELYDASSTVVDTAISDEQGGYSFLSVPGGGNICIVVPDGYTLLDDAQCVAIDPVATGDITLGSFTLSPDAQQANILPQALNIMGKVEADEGARGILAAQGSVSLSLLNASGTMTTTVIPDRGGNYIFNVIPADYSVCITIPGGVGLLGGNECQPVSFVDNTDVTLPVFLLSTLPHITRNGEGVLSFELGSTYIDAGATAEKDGRDLTDQIIISGLPDTNIPGTYVTTYAVVDPLTHLGATTSRVVTVLQKMSPTPNPVVIGGYAPSGSGFIAPSSIAIATTSASDLLPASSSTNTAVAVQDDHKKILKAELRKKAMGAVLGAETGVATTAAPNAIVVSTTALESVPQKQNLIWGYAKALLALVLFGGAIVGMWWLKRRYI